MLKKRKRIEKKFNKICLFAEKESDLTGNPNRRKAFKKSQRKTSLTQENINYKMELNKRINCSLEKLKQLVKHDFVYKIIFTKIKKYIKIQNFIFSSFMVRPFPYQILRFFRALDRFQQILRRK